MRGLSIVAAALALASPARAFDNFGQISLPCEAGSSSQSCPGVLRTCDQIKAQTLKSVEEAIANRIEGMYHGELRGSTTGSASSTATEQGTGPEGGGTWPKWEFPVCDLIAGEVDRSKAESCAITKDTHSCGTYQYTKVTVRGNNSADGRGH